MKKPVHRMNGQVKSGTSEAREASANVRHIERQDMPLSAPRAPWKAKAAPWLESRLWQNMKEPNQRMV